MTVAEAQTGFAKLLVLIGKGEEVELVKDHQPIAKIVPVRSCDHIGLAGSVLEEGDLVSPTNIAWEAAL